MRKLLFCAALFLAACGNHNNGSDKTDAASNLSVEKDGEKGRFNEEGFKDLRLGMTDAAVKKIVDFTLSGDTALVNYDGIQLKLEFQAAQDYHLNGIVSSDANAKVEGIDQNLIGKKYTDVKAMLGDKLQGFDFDIETEEFEFPLYTIYQRSNDVRNEETSCVLYFNEDGQLDFIMAAYNP